MIVLESALSSLYYDRFDLLNFMPNTLFLEKYAKSGHLSCRPKDTMQNINIITHTFALANLTCGYGMKVGGWSAGDRGVVRVAFWRVKRDAMVGTPSMSWSRGTPRPATRSTRESCNIKNLVAAAGSPYSKHTHCVQIFD